MSTPPTSERYPTVRQGYDPSLVESDMAAMEQAHQSVVDDASARISALEAALDLANSRSGANSTPEEANQIISSARKEAFRLITEAREEAGLVIAEARTETTHIQPESAPTPNAVPDGEVNAEELRLEARIVELQATLAGLEAGIRSLTGILASPEALLPDGPAFPPPGSEGEQHVRQPIALEGEAATQVSNRAENGGAALVEPLHAPQRQQSAPPPPPTPEPEPAAAVQVEDLTVEVVDSHEQAPAPDGGERASFYSRRSAQLPHIGAEAGRSAITAATDLRASMKAAGKSEG